MRNSFYLLSQDGFSFKEFVSENFLCDPRRSQNFGTNGVDSLFFEVDFVLGLANPPFMSENGQMCLFLAVLGSTLTLI